MQLAHVKHADAGACNCSVVPRMRTPQGGINFTGLRTMARLCEQARES